jgi:two-component system, cell cycle sensor histidine kinase and response regulator CckA
MADTKRRKNKGIMKTNSFMNKAADQEGAVKRGNRAAGPESEKTAPHNAAAILQSLVDNMQQGILFEGADRRVLFANQSFCTLFGIASPNAITGADCAIMADQAKRAFIDPEGFIATIERRLTEQKTALSEELLLRDGRIMERDYIPVMRGGELSGNYWIYRDITKRQRSEQALRESEDKFRSIFENAIDGIMIGDPETTKHVEANKAICAMLGYSHNELVGLRVQDIHPKEDMPRIQEFFERQSRGEITLAPDIPMLRKDGSIFYADINTARLKLGPKNYVVGVFRDVTERKRAERAIRESEEKFAKIFREAPLLITLSDIETGRLLDVNEQFLKTSGFARDEVIGRTVIDIGWNPETQRSRIRQKILENGCVTGMEISLRKKDGSEVIALYSGELITVNGERRLLSIVQDITERKRAEEKIRESEKFIRTILDTVDEGFIVVDRDYRILMANKAYCSQVGCCDEKVIGQHCFEISHKSSKPCYDVGEECTARQAFETGKPHSALHRHEDDNGNILFVETKAFPIEDAFGSVTSIIETINNITEKHLLEEERLKTQKLESIGTLAGGIAHDFNNLLQGIFGYIAMAKMTINQKEKALGMLERAENALHQSVNLTTQLLTFSKGGKPVKKQIDLRPVIENSARFTLSGSRSELSMDVAEDLWQAEADAGQVGQVIQNIVLNADQAMPLGGSVIVTATNLTESDTSFPLGLARGNYIKISIQDSGVGIPEQYIGKIFDPYFTTKEKGSGLGLATSYSIVRNHGGLIDIRTKPGEGSIFTVYLPAHAGQGGPALLSKPAGPPPLRTARVLVMDDEELLRDLSREMICSLGHEVEVAKHGREALAKYQEAMAAGKPFDIVILDLTVRGGMGGAETIKKLLEIDPAAKAIVSSGYSDDAALESHLSHGFRAYLKKPYDVDELRNILSTVLS